MGPFASDAPLAQTPDDESAATEAQESNSALASARMGTEAGERSDEWGEGSDWEEVEAPGSASAAGHAVASPPSHHQLPSSTAPGSCRSPELGESAGAASATPSGSSSPKSASDAQEESETEEEANLRRGRQLADTLAAAESVTEPAYDLALALGEGALAAALEGRAEPFPPLEESEEERDAFEAEFQRVLAEMGRTK